jgi:hypothetical protein
MAGAIGCAPAPSPVLSAPRGERQPPLECLAKPCSAPCHVFALFSTGVGQKTVDNSKRETHDLRDRRQGAALKRRRGGAKFVTLPSQSFFRRHRRRPFAAEGGP